MTRTRIGVIGLGGIAEQVHLPGLARSPHAEIFALCDQDHKRLALMGDRYAVPEDRRFTEYAALIRHPDVEAVDIATPNFLHHDPAMLAFQYRKPVNIEKPLALNMAEAREMAAAADAAGVKAMICFSYRFMAPVRFARWIIGNGFIGDILNIYIHYFKSTAFIENRPLEWRFQKALAGSGVLGDLGVHMVDLTRFLAGEIDAVCAQTVIAVKNRKRIDSDEIASVSTDDACDALMQMASQASASISVSRCAVGRESDVQIAIYGNQGMISFDPFNQDTLEICSGKLDFTTGSIHKLKIPPTYRSDQMDAFARYVQGDEDPCLPKIQDGLVCQSIIDAMLASAESRQWVQLSTGRHGD